MAYNCAKIWLGFENELITDKHKSLLDFTTDKIGGQPDWCCNVSLNDGLLCNACAFQKQLVLQLYAPLENSPYHRTLYLFTCVNPNCRAQNNSWICLRSQILDYGKNTCSTLQKSSPLFVCNGQDDWDNVDDNLDQKNGNVCDNIEEQRSDDDSNSTDELSKMDFDCLRVDDSNANIGILDEARGGDVMNHMQLPQAEIHIEENDESNFTSVETPTMPQQNLIALLKKPTVYINTEPGECTFLPLVSFFLAFEEEVSNKKYNFSNRHIDELLMEYQKQPKKIDDFEEDYEEGVPMHGDRMLFRFKNKIADNPSQLIRYSRENDSLLLLTTLKEERKKCCKYCGDKLIFEFQLLPTAISKIRLENYPSQDCILDFGTIIVFTCQSSCWSPDSTIQEEVVIVQHEDY